MSHAELIAALTPHVKAKVAELRAQGTLEMSRTNFGQVFATPREVIYLRVSPHAYSRALTAAIDAAGARSFIF